jgi:hypothetical protein
MRRPPSAWLVVSMLLVVSLLLAGPLLGRPSGARAEEPPVAPPARPGAPTGVERIADGLLAEVPGVRVLAEARVEQADLGTLRELVHVLRKRLEAALRPGELPRDAARGPVEARAVVSVRLWVLEATAEAGRELLGSATPGADGLLCFEPDAFLALLRRAEAMGLKRVTSPAVVTHAGQKASLAVEDHTPYVGGFEVREEAGRRVAAPQVEKVVHGLRLEVTPTLLGGAYRLEVASEQTVLVKPMATWVGSLGAGLPEVSIQLPELKSTRWSRRVVVAPGVTALLAGSGSEPGPGGVGTLVFVEARSQP